MTEELKPIPCPFCGVKVTGDMKLFFHKKNDCIFSEWQFEEPDVGNKWNRRAPQPQKADEALMRQALEALNFGVIPSEKARQAIEALRTRLSAAPSPAVEAMPKGHALMLASRLRDNADIDEAEGGNPLVMRLERDAAAELERLAALVGVPPEKAATIPQFEGCAVCGNKIGKPHERAMCREKYEAGWLVNIGDAPRDQAIKGKT